MVILFSLGISSTLGIYTMLPLYLVTDHGMDRNWANTLIGLSKIAGVGMALVGGWATDRFGPQRILRIVFVLTGMLTLFIGLASSDMGCCQQFSCSRSWRFASFRPVLQPCPW